MKTVLVTVKNVEYTVICPEHQKNLSLRVVVDDGDVRFNYIAHNGVIPPKPSVYGKLIESKNDWKQRLINFIEGL
jgi:hypothetical protein